LDGCAISSAYSRSRVRTSRVPVLIVSRTGWRCTWSIGRSVRCDSASNQRSDSMSSPNSSIRTGCGASGAYTSITPPRTANVPGSSTTGVRIQPPATSSAASSSRSIVPPLRSVVPRAASSPGVTVRRTSASADVTTMRGRSAGCVNRYSVATRSTMQVRSGDRSAYGDTSMLGSAAISSSIAAGSCALARKNRTSASIRRAAWSSGATTTTTSSRASGSCAASQADQPAVAPCTNHRAATGQRALELEPHRAAHPTTRVASAKPGTLAGWRGGDYDRSTTQAAGTSLAPGIAPSSWPHTALRMASS